MYGGDGVMQPALKEFVDGVVQMLGGQLDQVVLYGSVARGTNTEESDVDMNLKHNRVFSVVDINCENFRKLGNALPFYDNIRKDGVTLWTKGDRE